MNGAKIVELDLRNLSTECKKKFSEIRDDADNGIQTLLSLIKKYPDNPKKIKSADFASPFITTLKTNKVSSKLVDISLTGVLHLISYEMVKTSSLGDIVEAILTRIQLGTTSDMLIRMFQTIPVIIDNTNYILPSSLLHDVITILIQVFSDEEYSKEPILINTTKATLEQIILTLSQRVLDETRERISRNEGEKEENEEEEEKSYNKCLLMLLKDFLRIFQKSPPLWLSDIYIETDYAFDLSLSIINSHSDIFKYNCMYHELLKKEFVTPMMAYFNSDMNNHDITICFKSLSVLLTQYIDIYPYITEEIISYINKLVKKDTKEPKLDPYSMCCIELLYICSKHEKCIYNVCKLCQEKSLYSKLIKHIGILFEKGTQTDNTCYILYDKLGLFESRAHANFIIPEEIEIEKEDLYLYAFFIIKELSHCATILCELNDTTYNRDYIHEIGESVVSSANTPLTALMKYNKGDSLMTMTNEILYNSLYEQEEFLDHKSNEFVENTIKLTNDALIDIYNGLFILMGDFYPRGNPNNGERKIKPLEDSNITAEQLERYYKNSFNRLDCLWPSLAPYIQDILSHISIYPYIIYISNQLCILINCILHRYTSSLYSNNHENNEKDQQEIENNSDNKNNIFTSKQVVELLKWINLLLSNEMTRTITVNNLYDTIMESEIFTGMWRYILMPLKKTAPTNDCVEAFKSLQMILDDYLPSLSPAEIPDLISVIAAYAKQTIDHNVSLTSIGLLWKILDYILVIARKLDDFSKRKLINGFRRELYTCILPICYDPRPGIRNAALHTVFQLICAQDGYIIAGNYLELFDECINVLIEKIEATALKEEKSPSSSSPVIIQHHSRNTSEKQWNETRAIQLKGVARILKLLLPKLVLLPQLFDIYTHICDYVCSCIYREGKEVPLAAINCLEEISFPLLTFVDENDNLINPQIMDENRLALYKILYTHVLEVSRNNNLLNNSEVDDVQEYTDSPENLRLLFFSICQILSNDIKIGEKNQGKFNVNRRKGKLTNISKEIIILLFNMYLHMKEEGNIYIDIYIEETEKMLSITKEENMIREIQQIVSDLKATKKTIGVISKPKSTGYLTRSTTSVTSVKSDIDNKEEEKEIEKSIGTIEQGIFNNINIDNWNDVLTNITSTFETIDDEETCNNCIHLLLYIDKYIYTIHPSIINDHCVDLLFNKIEQITSDMLFEMMKTSNEYLEKVYKQIMNNYIHFITNTKYIDICKISLPSFLTIYISTFKSISNNYSQDNDIFTTSIKNILLYYFNIVPKITIDDTIACVLPPIIAIPNNKAIEPYISIYLLDIITIHDNDIQEITKKILTRILRYCGL
ncbi:hypothetical protein WA158_003200 [Blastocystis sp. Blastoise]